MTIVILEPPGTGAPPPYSEWLSDVDSELVLITARGAGEVAGAGYAEVRQVPDYATSAAVEKAVIELARANPVSGLVATATADLVRAGALRDYLGIAGPGRDAATRFADPVALRGHLRSAGVPAIPGAPVLRVSDLYWYRHRWGGALRVRHRKEPGWPTAAILADDADLRAFTANGLAPDLITVPSLFAEPHHDGESHVVADSMVDIVGRAEVRSLTKDALSALPGGTAQPYRVDVVRTGTGEWLVDTIRPATTEAGHRGMVRAQAGLVRTSQEVARWAS